MPTRPNVLFVMTDQQRFDTIAALGNPHVATPNLDRLAARGTVFDNAYSTSPVCVPARYTLRSGCEATLTDVYDNTVPDGGHAAIRERCGPYLAEAMRLRGYRTWGSASSTPRRGTRRSATTGSGTARSSTTAPSSGPVMRTRRGSRPSTPPTTGSRHSWESGPTCTTCRSSVPCRRSAPSNPGPPGRRSR
ncbi:sulfatase-like hydrolase/transferase [Nonomuraea thailandensis]